MSIDYEGLSIMSRTSQSKAAATQVSKTFQDHYPEFLVRAPDY